MKALDFLFPPRSRKWALTLLLSLPLPLLILLLRPLGLSLRQSAVVAILVLVITWWSTGAVKKIPASLALLLGFLAVGGAPAASIFAFPLSENFFLILITYVFSQGIGNAGLMDKLLTPMLRRRLRSPLQVLLAMTALLFLTIYLIPQPLARLILLAALFRRYLSSGRLPESAAQVLLFGLFLLYGAVNLATRNADIILNSAAVGFAGLDMSDAEWARHMLVPTLGYLALILGLFVLIFRRQLLGLRMAPDASARREKLDRRERLALLITLATVLLWVTQGLHRLSAVWVTLAACLAFAAIGVLTRRDLKAVDVGTLVFLTAAFCIGGVLKSSGTAEVLFSRLNALLPDRASTAYLLIIPLIAMIMHMLLGSNTTTLSVVIPSLTYLTSGLVPAGATMLLCVLGVCFHSILPFHSVALMIGAGNDYFPAGLVPRYGIPATLLVFLGALLLYLPWWRLTGLL